MLSPSVHPHDCWRLETSAASLQCAAAFAAAVHRARVRYMAAAAAYKDWISLRPSMRAMRAKHLNLNLTSCQIIKYIFIFIFILINILL